MERMMRFHHLLQNSQYPNCSTLGREFEVQRRTILRDLEFMKCRLDLRSSSTAPGTATITPGRSTTSPPSR